MKNIFRAICSKLIAHRLLQHYQYPPADEATVRRYLSGRQPSQCFRDELLPEALEAFAFGLEHLDQPCK